MSGKIRSAKDVILADKVMLARKEGDKWKVIELLTEAWIQYFPQEQEALRIDIQEQKKDLVDEKFGQTSGGKDMERRLIMIFPLRLQAMIRTQYSPQELKMDSAFYREFIKRFPKFQLSKKL